MKIVSILLAAAVAAVIGSAPALAQSTNSDSGGSAQPGSQMNAPTHPGPNQWARDSDWYARPGVPGYGRMGPWMMGPHARGMMGYRPGWRRFHHHSRGARFTFTNGKSRVDIRCPANQSLKDCVEAAGTLIDKVARMGPPPPPPPGQPKPPAPPPGGGQ